MELRVLLLLLLLLCFPGLQAQTLDAVESRWEGSTLHVQCPYTAQALYEKKVWCQVRDGQCIPLVETNNQATRGKVTIADNHMLRTVFITMTNLQVEDSGTYYCAYRSYSYGYFPLKGISLNVFKELLKWELDSLSVQCKYSTSAQSTDTKVWLRRGPTASKILLRTDYPPKWTGSKALKDRALIQDDTWKNTVTITMKKLQAQDTGTYWCELHSGIQQYTAKESGNVSIQCLYSASDYGTVSKAWCKEGARKSCAAVLVHTNSNSSEYPRTAQQGRVTIQDDIQQGIVTITMENLQAQDSGVYWCALYEQDQFFRMVEVTLSIPEVSAGTTLPGIAGTSQATPSGNTPAPSSNANTFILLSGILSTLFILALISSVMLCVRWRKQLKTRGNRQAEDIYDEAGDVAQLSSTERIESPKDDNKDLKYVTLNFKPQLSPEDPLYCNVEPSQAHRKPKDENVEYSIIALKHLPRNDKE
ncbi:PREDICTED: CMRF35-like molecule 1 [Apaloderma vittatum]|uniref:CMRF35-like molecule 1 n=1 Tax=Apaloderma vittatum TaxID=57397 RepID=UPI0005219ED1|nr:PREDICTED: CMRF35-like molecule 1 [Apaloderma vittatum]